MKVCFTSIATKTQELVVTQCGLYTTVCSCFYFVYITMCTHEKEEGASESVTMSPQGSRRQLSTVTALNQFPIWFFYNISTGQCECYNTIFHFNINGPEKTYPNGIKRSGQKAFIAYNHYMTYTGKKG